MPPPPTRRTRRFLHCIERPPPVLSTTACMLWSGTAAIYLYLLTRWFGWLVGWLVISLFNRAQANGLLVFRRTLEGEHHHSNGPRQHLLLLLRSARVFLLCSRRAADKSLQACRFISSLGCGAYRGVAESRVVRGSVRARV